MVSPVMVIGMKHCGSTMIFNLLRIAYKAKGHDVALVDKGHTVPKKRKEEESLKFIVPIRDPRDIAISGFLRFIYNTSLNGPCTDPIAETTRFGLHTFIDYMQDNILLAYEALLLPNTYSYRYEDFKENPVRETLRLFEFVGLPTDDANLVSKALDETNTYFERADLTSNLHEYQWKTQDKDKEDRKDVLLTRDHNTSGGKSRKYETFFTEAMNDDILKNPIVHHFLEAYDYL
jgi:hypothetical protein